MTGLATLRMVDWGSKWPMIGHYLKTPSGRTAFLVVEIRPPRKPGAQFKFLARCERTSAAVLPDDAIVHPFYWLKRG